MRDNEIGSNIRVSFGPVGQRGQNPEPRAGLHAANKEMTMRKLLLATAMVFAFSPLALAASVDGSVATGTGEASEGSVASSIGTGAALSGGIEDSQVASFDVSGAVGGHSGSVSGTDGATDVQTSGVTASTSSGHGAGAALGQATGLGSFAGVAAEFHH